MTVAEVGAPLPRLVVAGTRSGVGKTSIATGLMAALRRSGLRVSNHKVGPDFIDPSYHALATGRPPRNLDVVLHGAHRVAPVLRHQAAAADVAVVEGVMGLFDGRGAHDEASTAHVARLLDAPVVLVVDAAAASRSVAAEVHGFLTFDPTVRVAGVIVNRVGSDTHGQLVRDALAPLGVPVLGVLPRHDDVATPSRHLGLVPAAERTAEATQTVEALAGIVARAVDLDAVMRLARSAGPLHVAAWDPPTEVAGRSGGRAPLPSTPRIAVAGGRAFTFGYAEHRELLVAAGAEVVTVDPLRDAVLPEGTSGLVLGGGFPETYAAELSANDRLRSAVAAFAAAGGPVVAECGGLLYLCRTLDGVPMCGVLDLDATFTPRLQLGYREGAIATANPLGPAGTPVRGHEFHRTTVTPRAGPHPAWRLACGDAPGADDPVPCPEGFVPEGFVQSGVSAGYLHASWVATPTMATSLAAAAADHVRRRPRREVGPPREVGPRQDGDVRQEVGA